MSHDSLGKALKVILIFALLSLSCGLSLAGAQETPGPMGVVTIDTASEAARHIRLEPARLEKTTGRVAATATVEPNANAIAQITTRIPARVVKLIAFPGELVKPGQPLAILSSVELGDAKTEYLKTRSLEGIAAQNLKREQDLYAKQISALKDVLAARAAHDTALAQYDAAREKLALLIPPEQIVQIKWSRTAGSLSEFPLTSPIAGTLVRRDLVLGEAVHSDRPLMTVINLDKIWVNTNIYESDLAAVKVGDQALVRVEAYPERSFEGHVFYIGDEVDRHTRTVPARIEVQNQGHLLKPGMFAHAVIEGSGGSREAVIVPESAIFDYQHGKAVFIQIGANRYQARAVEVGGETGDRVEILAGLREGDEVVASGDLPLKTLLMNQHSR
ncbi:MAG TPA: efflux RND transporter periplasmic adaptor subunit [Candidatus Binataceae bacterium]|nr:efflux RND transporter periplasmic adaptor subunit [Candidatus Binataceae bacterium]